MSGKRLLTIVIIALLVFTGVILLIRSAKSPGGVSFFGDGDVDTAPGGSGTSGGDSSGGEVIYEKPVVQFETSSVEWENEKEYELSIVFEELTDPAPTALTLQILYDPEYVEVLDITEGNLWTGANILEKKIDNDKGQVMFSAGQNFSADITGNSTLATLKVRVVKSGLLSVETQFELGPETAIASVGINRLIMLQGSPVKIKINR